MKNLKILFITSLLVLGFSSHTSSQKSTTNSLTDSLEHQIARGNIINLISPQTYHLNSKGKTYISGENRICLKIQLPPNTIEWYYSICATNKSSNRNIELAAQIGTLMVRKNAHVYNIKIPDGNSYCNTYLLPDEQNKDKLFKNKPYKFFESESRQNFTSGIVKCSTHPNCCYLVIENDRKMHATDVTVDVVAIVQP